MSRENVDLDKQFQADMERAEALSLESLALEQFRNKKRLEESFKAVSNRDTTKPKVVTVSRAFSLTESDHDANRAAQARAQAVAAAKARPRPYMNTTGLGGGPQQQLIAPPPPAQGRRHSATTPPEGVTVTLGATVGSSTSATPDLISFTSPPVQNDLIEYCEQLHNLQKQVATLPTQPNTPQPFTNPSPNVINYNINAFAATTWQTPPPPYSSAPPSNGNMMNVNIRPSLPHLPLNLPNDRLHMQPVMQQQQQQSAHAQNDRLRMQPIMQQQQSAHALGGNMSPIVAHAQQPALPLRQSPMVFGAVQQQQMGFSSSAVSAHAYSTVLPSALRAKVNMATGLATDGPPPTLPPKAPTPSLKLRPPPIPPPINSNSTNSISSNRHIPTTAATGNGNSVRGHRRQTSNLIDLSQLSPPPPKQRIDGGGGDEQQNNVKVSILEAFDPLLNYDESGIRTLSPDSAMHETGSVCDSVYDEYDPYDFIYTGSDSNSLSDPLYVAVAARGVERAPPTAASSPTPPPTPTPPPRSSAAQAEQREEKLLLYDSIVPIDNVIATKNTELNSFHKMVQKLRNQFKYNDPDTNMGFVISPMLTHTYHEETSIKLAVYPHFDGADTSKPVYLTCDVTTSVEHITLQLTCDLEAPNKDQYTLKVWGCGEYLAPTSLLADYEYVHTCIKLEQDVKLILVPDRLVDKSLARTLQDDHRDKEITIQDIIPNEPNTPISYDDLKLLLVNLEKQISSLISSAEEIEMSNNPNAMPAFQPIGVKQSVHFVVSLMGKLEILEISEALQEFDQCCRTFLTHNTDFRDPRSGKSFTDTVKGCCTKLRSAILELIRMYSQAFMVNFELKSTENNNPETVGVNNINDYVVVRVCALYRPCPDWRYDEYMVAAQVYHGMRPLGHPVVTQHCQVTTGSRISFNCWLDMQDIFVSSLARESRLVFVLYGRTLQPADNKDDKDAAPYFKQEEIGWGAVQFFNYDGLLAHGSLLLSLWPRDSDFRYGPAPGAGTHPLADHPILGVEVVAGGGAGRAVFFPPVAVQPPAMFPRADFGTLDPQTREQLKQCADQGTLVTKIPVEVREILWEKRHYLYDIPNALPRVLCCAHRWDWFCLADLHGMLKCWKPMEPVRALELLLPTFPDMEVRKLAVNWIRPVDSDELVDYLPQLVVAYTQETYHESPLARFLLQRAMARPRVAHYLFWLLCHNLPGYMAQNSESFDVKPSEVAEFRHHRRTLLLLRALLAMCGEALRSCLIAQQFLSKRLHEIAVEVQEVRESQRMRRLQIRMDEVHQSLAQTPTALPLAPTLHVSGVHVPACAYFATNTLPLKVTFTTNDDGCMVPAIFKVGDDLQQDHLTLQIIRIMNKLWLKEGLDLKMVTFACIPTGKKRGIIEMVQKSETLRKIQVELGLTGSFKDKSIHEWLAKHNPSELEYTRAVENFTASCAGYCVVTYILGICDRHNDNIMLKTSGHMFHIDFGKFLGDAQMFGNFKRDRTPFVLTSDMAYVINGGDRPTEKFQKFVDLCCQAFNIVRNNGNLFLYLVTFMAASGSIKGLTTEAVAYLHRALMPDKSNADAAACFTRLIESSLNSLSTQVNFFIHNIAAQLKFSSDGSAGDGGELLSFIPNKYSMETDGKLTEVQVVGYRKCYDPDKYYVYILQVMRVNVTEHARVLRTYKEFCELHQKLCISFPLAKLYSLSTGLQMGRSNIKQVAEKRLRDISYFLQSLFRTADEIAHSDLVYTFFHPLLRDQQLLEHLSTKKKDRVLSEERRSDVGKLSGQVRLSLLYGKGVFGVMVQHARGLPPLAAGHPPSAYVKVYLIPDPAKTTKRKTKVVRRNCHPSYMEMLEYRMPLELIRQRTLKATVWNSDPLQENEFLGGVELPLATLDLTQEITEWYSLGNVTR